MEALEILFGAVKVIGEVAIENNEREKIKKSFSLTFEELKAKYNYCRHNRTKVPYDSFTKATVYYTMMKMEGETIISMIPYRTPEESIKLMKNFITKYQIETAQEVHIHIHVNEVPNKRDYHQDIYSMFFGK